MSLVIPLSCPLCRRMLPAYLAAEAGRLTAGVVAYPSVAAHLLDCPACADLANQAWGQWDIWRRSQTVLSGTGDDQGCRPLHAMLPFYLEQVVINPHAAATAYPRGAAHLATCSRCQTRLDITRLLVAAVQVGQQPCVCLVVLDTSRGTPPPDA